MGGANCQLIGLCSGHDHVPPAPRARVAAQIVAAVPQLSELVYHSTVVCEVYCSTLVPRYQSGVEQPEAGGLVW